jgi:hypothetical protein
MTYSMLLSLGLTALCGAAPSFTVQPVPDAAAQARLCDPLLPMPKQCKVLGVAHIPARSLRVVLPEQPTELDRCAAAELAAVLADALAQGPVAFGGAVDGFALVLRRSPDDEAALKGLRNSDQAYRIVPVTAQGEVTSLVCGAITDVGTYYAVKTLKQLIAANLHGKGDAATIDLPICDLVDSPDLGERGEWGGSCLADLEWMSDCKFNLLEVHATLTVDADRTAHAAMDPKLMERGRNHAVRIVPIIHHLEQLDGTGIFKAYPELKGVDAPTSICFARPEAVTVLSQWLADLGKIPGVFDVMIWLSEEMKGCQCPVCAKEDRWVQEARSCIAAWEIARKQCPGLGLRLLLTQGSYPTNDKVLAVIPDGVKVSYYHGGLTYNTARSPMIYKLMEDYAKRGRWLGIYPTLGTSWLTVAPFSSPQFVRARMNEFVDKGLSCLVQFTIPGNAWYRVNVEGSAEWSWNAHGRSTRDFALSYARRHGIAPPEAFADWIETLGPVSWDVYGSHFPFLEYWQKDEAAIAAGQVKRALGANIFGEFKEAVQFDRDLDLCDTALTLAEKTGDQAAILETRIVRDYLRMLRCVWDMGELIKGEATVSPQDKPAVDAGFATFARACSEVQALYPLWVQALGVGTAHDSGVELSLRLVEDMSARMAQMGEKFGIPDVEAPFRRHGIGAWDTPEFAQKPDVTRRLDVTAFVAGPGTYVFEPIYSGGSLGLVVTRVALVSFAKNAPDAVREEAADEHRCHAGAWVEGGTYRLPLAAYDAARGYAVVADIHGGSTTTGTFTFRKLHPEQ